jgi:tetratricopeptide (TPR) repeat protein
VPTDRTVKVRLTADPKGFIAGMKAASKSVADLRHDIDSTNDRTAWLAQSFLALAPSAVGIGAAGIPALAGLTTQLGLAVGAAGTAALAFSGIGDALGKLNDYQMDPTAAKLKNLQIAMSEIGEEGAEFVRFLDSVGPAFNDLQDTARGQLFPGVEDSIRTFVDDLLPRVKVVVSEVAGAMGDLAREGSQALAGPRWEAFFEFLQTQARPTLVEMSRAIGNFTNGFANLLVAFGPMTEDFSRGLLKMSRSFAEWSANLDDNGSFQDFLSYIQDVTPKVLDLFESLVGATVSLVEAAGPVGEQMLPIFSKFLDIVSAIAETPLGPVIVTAAAAIGLLGRAMALATITTGGTFGKITKGTRDAATQAVKARLAFRDLGNAVIYSGHSVRDFQKLSSTGIIGRAETINALKARDAVKQYGKQIGGTAAQAGLLAVAMSDLDDKTGLTNTAMGALIGSMAGPYGAAAGAAIGFTLDMAKANDELVASTKDLDAAIRGASLSALTEELASAQAALDALRASGSNSTVLGNSNPVNVLADVLGFNDDEVDESTSKIAEAQKRVEDLRVQLRTMNLDTKINSGPRGQGQLFHEIEGSAADAARATRDAKMALREFAEELMDVQSFLDSSNSLIQYERNLDAMTEALKVNGDEWDVSTKKGQDNLTARNALVDSAILRAQDLIDKGDELGAQRILDRAVKDLENFAKKSPEAKRAMQPLIEELKDLDQFHAKPDIKVQGKGKALNEINEVNTALEALERHLTTLRLDHMDIRLGGGTYAEGGYTGAGGKYEPAGIVHKGEFVFDQATTSRNRGLFEAIHRGMAGYANGGYVQATASPAAAPLIDYNRLADAIGHRQMYGDVTVIGDGQFEKQMRTDSALARKGGA